jgi:hypothetical protein
VFVAGYPRTAAALLVVKDHWKYQLLTALVVSLPVSVVPVHAYVL